MKKCKKCGRVFEDDDLFCTSCGEKLVSENCCPRCGAEVTPDDAFCAKCGFDLKNGNKCKKCGTELREGSQFCHVCGAPIENNQKVKPEKVIRQEKQKVNTSELIRKIFNYALMSLFLLASLFMIMGFFGKVMTAHALGVKESIGIKYFFGDRARDLKQIKEALDYPDYYHFVLSYFIVHSVTYFGGMIGMFVVVGLGIRKFVKCIINKELFPRKYFILLLSTPLLYLMFTSFLMILTSDVSVKSTFGWGTGMLFASCIICAVSFMISFISEAVFEKKNIVIRSLVSVAFFLTLFTAIFGVRNHIAVSESGVTANVSVYVYVSAIAQSSSVAGWSGFMPSERLMLYSFIFAMFPFLLVPASLLSLTKEKLLMRVSSLVYIVLTAVFALICAILADNAIVLAAREAAVKTTIVSSFGSGSIVAVVLSLVSMAALIASFTIKQKE